MSRGRRRCGYRDISSQHKITSLIKGAQATCNPGGRYAPCGDAPKQQGRGAPAAWVVGFLPRVGFLDDTNFANSRDTLDAACVRHARGRGARTPDGAVPAPGHWASRSQEVCADRRLDIVIEVQTQRHVHISQITRAGGAHLASSHRERCFAVRVQSTVHHALCPDHVLVVYRDPSSLNLPPPPDGESQRHAPW
jgi:hypothetical protein